MTKKKKRILKFLKSGMKKENFKKKKEYPKCQNSTEKEHGLEGTARRSNLSVLKEISLEYSLERLMLKLKF